LAKREQPFDHQWFVENSRSKKATDLIAIFLLVALIVGLRYCTITAPIEGKPEQPRKLNAMWRSTSRRRAVNPHTQREIRAY
jgi:hypothetical protein